MIEDNSVYKAFESLYKNVLQKGVTFSSEMGKEIHNELDKMIKQRDEWLKKHDKETEV